MITCGTQVKLGERLLGSAGCLFYPDVGPSTSSGRSLSLIVVVGTIGVALIVLLTLAVLRAYVHHRRAVDEERKPLDHPKVCTWSKLTVTIVYLRTMTSV